MIFITDLDKTLLRSDLSISEFSKNVWNNFKYPLTVATARSYTSTKNLLKDLKLNYPLILLDGAIIAKPNGKVIKINAINKDLANGIIKDVYKNFNEYPLIVGFDEISNEKFLYPNKLNKYQQELLNAYKNDKRVIQKLKALNFNLKMVYLGEFNLIDSIKNFLTNYEVELKMTKDPYIDCYFLTVLNKNADKSKAIEFLENMLNWKNITVFGDSINDIGMFKYANTKIAVKNAIEELKQIADIILPYTNDEDAVAKYLSQYL